jgi:hypothetical protein
MYNYLLDNHRNTAGVQRRLVRSQGNTIGDELRNMLWRPSRIEQKPTRRQRFVVWHLICLDEYTPSAIVLEYENELELLKDVQFGAVKIKRCSTSF